MKNIPQKYLYLFLLIIPVLIGIVSFWSLWRSPYTGIHFEQHNDKWYITSIDTDSPASKYPEMRGMEIVSIAGWEPAKSDLRQVVNEIQYPNEYWHFWEAQKYLWDNVKINKPIVITTNVKGVFLQYSIIPSQIKLVRILTSILGIIYLSALITLVIGLVVILNKPDNEAAKVFFFLTFTIGIYTITSGTLFNRFVTFEPTLFKELYFISLLGALLIPATLHFALVFPYRYRIIKHVFFTWLLYSIILILGVVFFFRISFIAYQIAVISQLFYLFAAAGIAIYNYFKIISPIEKAQMKWVVLSFVIMTLSGCFVIMEQVFLGRFDIHIVMMIFPILPLAMAFAIMRYKLMDIDTLFDNTLIYSVTIGLLAMIDVAIVYILTSNKIPLLTFKSPFPTIIAVWVIIFAYLPVRNFVRDKIKRILKREMYDLNEVSTSYSQNLLSAYSTDDVIKMARDLIERTLHPKSIEIDILDNSRELRPVINTEAGEAFIPLSATSGSVGLIALGEKHSGRLYDRDDVRLLNTIANQTALAIESIRHREGMRLKEEDNRAEKERISKEVHDGIGSSLVQAKLLVDMAKNDPQKLSEASGIIDNGIKEMRELIWVVEQDEQTLGDLVYHIDSKLEQVKGVLNINLENSLEDEDIVLTPEQKLNLSRIVQESMTNIIKHAQASRVDISFIEKNKYLEIVIRDNGKGFEISKIGSESYGLRNMRARAEKIGAQFVISSETGKGSEIRLAIRLSAT